MNEDTSLPSKKLLRSREATIQQAQLTVDTRRRELEEAEERLDDLKTRHIKEDEVFRETKARRDQVAADRELVKQRLRDILHNDQSHPAVVIEAAKELSATLGD